MKLIILLVLTTMISVGFSRKSKKHKPILTELSTDKAVKSRAIGKSAKREAEEKAYIGDVGHYNGPVRPEFGGFHPDNDEEYPQGGSYGGNIAFIPGNHPSNGYNPNPAHHANNNRAFGHNRAFGRNNNPAFAAGFNNNHGLAGGFRPGFAVNPNSHDDLNKKKRFKRYRRDRHNQ